MEKIISKIKEGNRMLSTIPLEKKKAAWKGCYQGKKEECRKVLLFFEELRRRHDLDEVTTIIISNRCAELSRGKVNRYIQQHYQAT